MTGSHESLCSKEVFCRHRPSRRFAEPGDQTPTDYNVTRLKAAEPLPILDYALHASWSVDEFE